MVRMVKTPTEWGMVQRGYSSRGLAEPPKCPPTRNREKMRQKAKKRIQKGTNEQLESDVSGCN